MTHEPNADLQEYRRQLQEHRRQLQECKRQPRGPLPGGGGGPGKPWGGIIEDTPALWVGWIVDAARRAGRDPLGWQIKLGETALQMATVTLTFGVRYYWRCPMCGRRCEAVYDVRFLGVGCRRCMKLGYRSQTHRAASPYAAIDRLYGRDLMPRRYADPGNRLDCLIDSLHGVLQGKIDELVGQVKITAAQGDLDLPNRGPT